VYVLILTLLSREKFIHLYAQVYGPNYSNEERAEIPSLKEYQ